MPSSGRQGNGRHGARACVFCVGPFYSESSADVAHAITYAKSLGARVVLGPLVDPNWALRSNHRGSPAYPGAECILWRAGKVPGMVQPANCTMHGSPPTAERGPVGEFFSEAQWDAWFASYGAMMLTHARLAQANGADTLVVAAELWAAMVKKSNVPRWTALMAKIRAVYSGKLAVAANARTLIPWHHAVDILGFDMCVVPPHTHTTHTPPHTHTYTTTAPPISLPTTHPSPAPPDPWTLLCLGND